ncbi:MAG TPA: FtsX-like permease family protein [Kofleriaceae bacterium]|nr:FtsX-like permease family protein [Kofleriaceae bacterium]
MIPLRYNVRSLLVRRTTSLATLIGVALVVFVLATALMLTAGIDKTLAASGSSDHVVVLRKGSDAEMASSIETSALSMVLAGPGVKKDSAGKPIGSGEIVTVILGDKADGSGGVSNVLVRGVADNVMELRPEAHVIEGRPARPGSDEVIIGRAIRGRFKGMDLGQHFDLKKNRPLTVVGVFEDGGSSFESEVWADVETVRSSFGREGTVTSATVTLDSPSKHDAFKLAVEQDKRLGLEVLRETTYYEKQSEATSMLMAVLGWVISVFFIIAAVIGAFITMNTAVAHRKREVGTLRAIGFSRRAILMSFTLECIVLAMTGAAIGVVLASLMSFVRFSVINWASWSEIVFTFQMTPGIVVTSVVVGGMTGLLGGIIPAFRASRMRPIDALRA